MTAYVALLRAVNVGDTSELFHPLRRWHGRFTPARTPWASWR
ncbi:hypothetical protein [Stenotrophomonas indicatrix]